MDCPVGTTGVGGHSCWWWVCLHFGYVLGRSIRDENGVGKVPQSICSAFHVQSGDRLILFVLECDITMSSAVAFMYKFLDMRVIVHVFVRR